MVKDILIGTSRLAISSRSCLLPYQVTLTSIPGLALTIMTIVLESVYRQKYRQIDTQASRQTGGPKDREKDRRSRHAGREADKGQADRGTGG